MKRFLTPLLLFCALAASAQRYHRDDSLAVCRLLGELAAQREGPTPLEAALRLAGTPYVAHTLEGDPAHEVLCVNIDSVDCTTYVEQCAALYLTAAAGDSTFAGFCRRLQQLRYRDGLAGSYAHRLHYFSEWAAQGEALGVMRQCGGGDPLFRERELRLGFMSSHPQSYPALSGDEAMRRTIAAHEARLSGTVFHYLPKELLGRGRSELPVGDGDIVALVTDIEGLDVTHLGFAVWQGEVLHLLHASSAGGRVVLDSRPLSKMIEGRKSCPGVRVVRLVPPGGG